VLLGRLRASATSPQPLYAFMHFLELHSPYAPISKKGDVTYAAKILEYTSTCLVAGCDMSQTNNQELAATALAGYRALMSEVDDVIGEVLSIARQRQRPFRLVVTADHGELFGEYGAFAHRFGFVPELRHVPFILHDSTKPTASRRCELMLSTDALRTAVLGGEYRGHDKLDIDVPGVGRGLIDRQAATLTFELSEGAVANSGVSRNMHREAKGALPYPIVTCE